MILPHRAVPGATSIVWDTDPMTVPDHPGLRDLDEIGRGGFGVVYRARQEGLDRHVAVKFLTARPGEQIRDCFAQECRALGQLSGHPHNVGVHDGGVRADGRAFLVMPFYAKGSLSLRLRRSGPLGWPEVVDIGVRLAGALQTAHDAGILHRDLKPANILVDDYDGPRLADFGQARLADSEQTRTGEVAITPGFAAPEVLNGQRATAQSDIYALSAALVALLLGKAPFDTGGDLVSMFYRVVNEPPPDVRPLGVPDEVARVLERAMSKDPTGRFESAERFGAQLRAAQEQLGLTSSPLLVAGRRPPCRRWTLSTPTRPVAAGRPSAPAAPRRRSSRCDSHRNVTDLRNAAAGWLRSRCSSPSSSWQASASCWSASSPARARRPHRRPGPARRARRRLPQTPTSEPTSSSPSPTTAPVGQADVSAVSGDPAAAEVGETLSTYFLSVNDRDFDRAYAVFSPALRDRIAFPDWSAGLSTTVDSGVRVVGIDPLDDGALQVQATFVSNQSATDGPVPGETCSKWTLTYRLVPNVDGATAYQIDGVSDVGPGHTAC